MAQDVRCHIYRTSLKTYAVVEIPNQHCLLKVHSKESSATLYRLTGGAVNQRFNRRRNGNGVRVMHSESQARQDTLPQSMNH